MHHSDHTQSQAWPSGLSVPIWLYLATIASQLAYVSYQAAVDGNSFADTLLPSIIFLSVITIPAVLVGYVLGKPLGLGFLNYFNQDKPDWKKGLLFAVATGIAIGLFLLVLRSVLQPYLPAETPAFGFRGVTGGMLVSISAAIGEEVWFRYGLMVLVLSGIAKLGKVKTLSNTTALLVIIFSAIAFAAVHLPQLFSYGAGSPFAIWATLLGNTAVGTLFGWCFWRYGLLSAITAHFSVDVVLHVLPALW